MTITPDHLAPKIVVFDIRNLLEDIVSKGKICFLVDVEVHEKEHYDWFQAQIKVGKIEMNGNVVLKNM